ncbi:MAG: transcriptional repressor LexA [Candidatus Bipolaricaulota bacterium]|nr:transcriptional repressor LexA [Candidatus Bipolaricaulota bacterium]MBS3791558.1 transcriptional repressor LexA [Candidatus Bipolaricaulota bacterium]
MYKANLTKRQYEILEYVHETIEETSRPPTIREIGRKFSISSTKGVFDHLSALEKKGWIERIEGQARGISPVKEKTEKLFGEGEGVPVVGSVVAGEPTLAVENVEGLLDLKEMFPNQEGLFALRVDGESMVEAGIYRDDLVIVRQQPTAEVGDTVVAVLEGEKGTVKKLSRLGEKIHLEPANTDYETIVKDPSEVEIRGRVVGVVRKM